jgi:hypothetical protein
MPDNGPENFRGESKHRATERTIHRSSVKHVLLQTGDTVEHGEEAEEKA